MIAETRTTITTHRIMTPAVRKTMGHKATTTYSSWKKHTSRYPGYCSDYPHFKCAACGGVASCYGHAEAEAKSHEHEETDRCTVAEQRWCGVQMAALAVTLRNINPKETDIAQ